MKVQNMYLLSSHGCLVQDKADLSLTASAATVAFLNIFQQKSHSSTPPAAMALQYTVDLRFGWILTNRALVHVYMLGHLLLRDYFGLLFKNITSKSCLTWHSELRFLTKTWNLFMKLRGISKQSRAGSD